MENSFLHDKMILNAKNAKLKHQEKDLLGRYEPRTEEINKIQCDLGFFI